MKRNPISVDLISVPHFWSQVAVVERGNCWLWKGMGNGPDGYGRFTLDDGSAVVAHRVAYCLTHGTIPTDSEIMHVCDVMRCCNPSHLVLGTHSDNVRDAMTKGRLLHRKGSGANRAALTSWQVKEIRAACAKGELQRAVGARYGVSQYTISRVVNRRNYADVE